MGLKSGYARTDTDGLVYKREDTFWAVWPDHEEGDPGVCDHKAGATPIEESEYWEPDSVNQTDPHPNPYGNTATGHFYPHLGEGVTLTADLLEYPDRCLPPSDD